MEVLQPFVYPLQLFFLFLCNINTSICWLEVAILSIAFYLNFKWSSQKEVIYINPQEVRIEKGNNKLEFSWKEFRTFTSFVVSKEDKDNIQLGFRSKGQTIYVGSFLNFDEKKELKEEVSKIISELNSFYSFHLGNFFFSSIRLNLTSLGIPFSNFDGASP